MRIIALKTFREFWFHHNLAKEPLLDWYKKVEKAHWDTPADVKRTFGSVDFLSVHGTLVSIFNLGGNKYRIIGVIHFNTKRVFIRAVMTHAEYDTGKWKDEI